MKKTLIDILISVCMCIISFSVLALINLLLENFLVALGFIIFLVSLFLLVAVLIADTIFIKKWYFFLICTLPLSIQPAYSAFQVYQIYNNEMYSQTNLSSTEILVLFAFLHLFATIALMWSITGTVLIYKLRRKWKTNLRYVLYALIITACVLIAGTQLILMIFDFLFRQTALSSIVIIESIILIFLILFKSDRLKNQLRKAGINYEKLRK
ncbi:hypothetical protein [Ruminococcus sp.]|uniref:hypothetical protein n=1 Tax=Ruminococcus sp. TaxID=41978 RepID=UPI003EFDDC74